MRLVCRHLLALGLVLTVFLPTLVITASAYIPVETPSENEHWVIYRGTNGDTVCREATEAEARDLDQIKPTGLQQINHLELLKPRLSAEDLPQHLTIILRATDNLKANPAAEAAFNRAAAAWENVISSPITIFIDVDYGPTNFGQAWPAQVLGSTSSPTPVGINYDALRRNLIATANTPEKLAIYSALPANTLPTDLGSVTSTQISKSIARAIGFSDPTAPSTDPAARIGFNSQIVTYDFDGTEPITGTDFEAVATHEIGHALGFTSRSGFPVPQSGVVSPAMWDLYRFRPGMNSGAFPSAQRIMTIGGPTPNAQIYFFPGQNELGLSNGGPDPENDPNSGTNNSDHNQSSHWRQQSLNSGVFIGIMDPRIPGGIRRQITVNDINALNLFGYNNGGISQGAPLNDNLASAQTVAGCSGTAGGTNVFATREANENNHSPDGNGGSRSVWYTWQAPATGTATIDTFGTGFDTVLGVYTGTTFPLTVVGKDDDTVERTSRVSFAANAGTVYRIAVDGFNNNSGGDAGPITLNFSETNCSPSFVLLSAANYTVSEDANSLTVDVTRTGSTGATSTVNFATSDGAGLTNCTAANGLASERCDYGSANGTLRFGPGETTKSFTIPIVNDGLVEGNETFSITLSSPSGMTLASPQLATVTIQDNDNGPPPQNPIDGIPFFVTQQYIDFLGRLPDSVGFQNWVDTLNGCPNGGFGENLNPGCDRVHVSAGFFLSAEFQGRGYFAYRFYEVALDRRPTYAEFVPDMAIVGGPQSPESEVLSKQAYTDAWLQRTEFKSRYDNLSNTAYVNALEANAEVTVSNKQALIDALNGGQMNRGQVLRNIVESQAVADRFFNRAFVSMQYFGYLRRDPDTIGFQNWLDTINADPSNTRHMIFGFLFSTEYRQRFGP
ncbi:MAG TPA: NF038122 family metalloprotease [Pyrinomonadaceae bacterium]|nr:NF038122 family metalloprotease [Pyrinomonadaceae bacterium]